MMKLIVSFRIARFFSIELGRRYRGVTVSGRRTRVFAGALVIDGTKPSRSTLTSDSLAQPSSMRCSSRRAMGPRIVAPRGTSFGPVVDIKRFSAPPGDDASGVTNTRMIQASDDRGRRGTRCAWVLDREGTKSCVER